MCVHNRDELFELLSFLWMTDSSSAQNFLVYPIFFTGCTWKWWAPWSQGKFGQCHKLSSMSSSTILLSADKGYLYPMHWLIIVVASMIFSLPCQPFTLSHCVFCICYSIIFFFPGSPRRARTSRSAGNPRNSGEDSWGYWRLSRDWLLKSIVVHRYAHKNKRKRQSRGYIFTPYIEHYFCFHAGNAWTSGSSWTPRRESKLVSFKIEQEKHFDFIHHFRW